MTKLLILLATLTTITIAHPKIGLRLNHIVPYDLKNQAEKQLDELIIAVKEKLNEGETKLLSKQIELVYNKHLALVSGQERISAEYTVLHSTLNTIKQLASGYDIRFCLQNDEPGLVYLPSVILRELENCTATIVDQSDANITKEINLLNNYSNEIISKLQLDLYNCQSVTCLTQVVKKIQNYLLLLPQDIESKINENAKLIDIAAMSITQCLETEVAAFTTTGLSIIKNISSCVDRIMS